MKSQSNTNYDPLEHTIDLLYEKMLEDEVLKPFFDGADVNNLKRKQNWFLASLLMSNTEGTADYMRSTHAQLVNCKGLEETHFDKMVHHLKAAAQEAELPSTDQKTVIKAIEQLRGPVLGK